MDPWGTSPVWDLGEADGEELIALFVEALYDGLGAISLMLQGDRPTIDPLALLAAHSTTYAHDTRSIRATRMAEFPSAPIRPMSLAR